MSFILSAVIPFWIFVGTVCQCKLSSCWFAQLIRPENSPIPLTFSLGNKLFITFCRHTYLLLWTTMKILARTKPPPILREDKNALLEKSHHEEEDPDVWPTIATISKPSPKRKVSKGRPLSLIMCLVSVVSGLAWALTIWIASGRAHSEWIEFHEASIAPGGPQCDAVSVDYR